MSTQKTYLLQRKIDRSIVWRFVYKMDHNTRRKSLIRGNKHHKDSQLQSKKQLSVPVYLMGRSSL